MSSEGYDAFDDPYAYPGTTVLKNLLDLKDQDTLDAFEVEISTLRAEEPLPEGNFDPGHYCAVHHHLFQDVYDWAGQYRTVRTSKGGNAFCYPENIRAQIRLNVRRRLDVLAKAERCRCRNGGFLGYYTNVQS
jgi:cell filamentation protein